MKAGFMLAWILGMICMSTQAQTTKLDYRPFAQECKKWETQVGGIKEHLYGNKIEGDTIIAGETWKKVYNYVGFNTLYCSYYAAIRDVGDKVYAIAQGSKKPRLLYDFGLNVGDLLKCGIEGKDFCCLLDKDEPLDTLFGFPFKVYLRVERIDTITYVEKEYRRFTFTALDGFQEYFYNDEGPIRDNIVWVEGIGSGAGPFSPWMPLPSWSFSRLECLVGNEYVFNTKGFFESGKTNTISDKKTATKKETSVYDLQGRRLKKKSSKGIYIQNGKKVLSK